MFMFCQTLFDYLVKHDAKDLLEPSRPFLRHEVYYSRVSAMPRRNDKKFVM